MQFLSKKKIQKPVESSFIIKHGYAYHLRNIETGKAMAWYQNLKSPWFDKMAEEKKWSEEKEEKHDQDEKGDNPTMKWSSEKTLMVEIKIVEDPQAPLHVGVGRLPDWLQNKKGLDTCTDEVCVFSYLAVHRGAHRQYSTKENHVLAESFFVASPVRGREIHKGHFPLTENHFQQGIARCKVDAEGTFLLKYLPSRFDKAGEPQLNVGINQDHAFWITNLDKITKHHACAECQVSFTQACPLQQHAEEGHKRGNQRVVSRRAN